MRSDSTSNGRTNDVTLYFMAGVRTAPHFMENFRLELQNKLEQQTSTIVRSELLFPCGDWSRSIVPQLWEIRHDMRLNPHRISGSIGGNRVLESIVHTTRKEESRPEPSTTVFIGHSGGGIAAVHASHLRLEREGGSPCPVIMIGSPRCRIPEKLRKYVLYIQAGASDRVVRLGTFGGWTAGRFKLPKWRSDKHAPENRHNVPIIGGHPDYFRDREPYVRATGESNLDLTAAIAVAWLKDWLNSEGEEDQ